MGTGPSPSKAVIITDIERHLSNDGIEISPPSRPFGHNAFSSATAHPNPSALFSDLEMCNVGFQQFHPMPVTQNGNKLAGQGGIGGLWEWTSSPLEKHEGFEPMDLYPAYTSKSGGLLSTRTRLTSPYETEYTETSLIRVGRFVGDFFDGKHNIVLGGSWATHPRIAGRHSL